MSQQGSEGEGSVNPRRSLRHKMPRIGWGMDKGTGDTKKVSYSSQRSINKRVNSNSLYGCSRSSVAGIRKLQRKGQQVKGSELLAKMTERRKKLTKGVRRREKGKEIDTNGGGKSDNGFSIPLSILNNIPDIGLCPLEEEANKRHKRRSNSSFESISSTKKSKLSGTCSDSSAGSSDSTTHLLTKRNSDNAVDRLTPKVQNTASRIHNGINRNRSSKPVDHFQVLESWYHDCSHDSTKPPILWALDNMANKLIEDIEWMKRAEAIWSKWIKLPTSTRTVYISKAKDNEKNRRDRQRGATMTNGHIFNGSLNDSDNNIAGDSFNNRSTHTSTIPSNTVAAQTTPHVQQTLTPGETSSPVPPMVTSWLGNNHNNSPVPFQMAANSFTNIIPLCFPSSFPSSLMLTAHDSLKSPTISSTPSFPKDHPFLLPSTPVLKLMALPPISMGVEGSDVTKSTMASSLPNSGIPILKIENPHRSPFTNHSFPKSPAHHSNNISPAVSNPQSSFCISSILANTSVLSSAPSTNIISSNRKTVENRKKKNRMSPYRISNNTPLMKTVDSSLKRSSTTTNIATSSSNKAGRSSKKASSNLSNKNIMNTASTVFNTSKVLGEQSIVNSMSTATAHLPISQPMVTATPTRPSSLQLIDNTTYDNSPIGKSIGSVITTNTSRLINNSQSSPTIPQMIDNSSNNEGVPLSLTIVTDEWKRSLEKQLRANKTKKSVSRKGNDTLKSISNSHVIKNTDDKSKRKKSNVLSRPPMKLTTPSVLNQTIFERTISSSVEPSLVSPALPLNFSMAAKPFPSSSPLASPSFNILQSPGTLSNNFGSSYSQLSYRYPASVRSTSPALFVPRAVSATPSPVSTPSVISSDMLKASNPDIRIKATTGGLLSTPELLSPDDQAKVDARNYADLERHYWSLLLAFEEQKKTISSLKERMVKARVEQQILLLGDERFNNLKEMIVSPIWEPVEPDLLDSLNETQISTEVRIKGSFDKPILENEDVYKYLLHSVSL